jgi:hypothetical protein
MSGTDPAVLAMQQERFALLNGLWERVAAFQGG